MEKMGDDGDVEQDREDKDTKIGSPSSDGNGKIVIKLKIPKLVESSKMAEEGKRVCLECNKKFSSGKALGGHMRVHVQNPNFIKPLKTTKFKKTILQNSQTKPYYLNSVNHEGVPICSQCHKTFPTMKSLFGHMRCHPERVWRGILPPPNAAVNHRSSGGDEVVDLTKFLSGWSVTEKRGRSALKPFNDQNDDVLLEAAEDLMSFANGGPGSGPPSAESNITEKQLKVEVVEGSNSNSLSNKDDHMLMVSSKYKKRKKMKLMMELDQEQEGFNVDECKYKCTTCNKCFSSHQALGGHRSSHNNKPKINIASEDEYVGFENNLVTNNSKDDEFGIHQCKICGKVFATGQALGGHKRCHWTGTIEPQARALSSQVTSTGEAASRTESGKKVLDFDLNEIPPAPALMEDGTNGNEYASSHNSNMG